MRRHSLTRLILVVFVLGTGLATGVQTLPFHRHLSVAQTITREENRRISLTLPPIAIITLKQGGTKSGRLISIDPQTQQITLYSGNNSQVAIAAIQKVVFQGEIVLRGKTLVIRGETQSSGSNQKTWTEPLTNFKVKDPSKGEAEINLNSLPKDKWRGIQSVAQDSSYVVEEMSFESSQKKLTVRVTPH